MIHEIMIRNIPRPRDIDALEDIEWLSESFGFVSGRDTERTAFKIFRSCLNEIAKEGSVSTDRLADELDMAEQRINYHLRQLIDSGFLYRSKRQIYLREGSVRAAVEEMRRDTDRIFDKMMAIAEEIDKGLGIRNR